MLGALLIPGILNAPPAHASALWAAIIYGHDIAPGVYYNYGSETKLITDIQNDYPTAGHVRFSSGHCGAVVSYEIEDPFGTSTRTEFETGVGSSEDAATNRAINKTFGGRYKLLKNYCQN